MTGTAARYTAAEDLCPRAGGAAAGHTAGPSAEQEGGQGGIPCASARLSRASWAAEGQGEDTQGRVRLGELPHGVESRAKTTTQGDPRLRDKINK